MIIYFIALTPCVVYTRDNSDNTAFHVACQRGHLEVTELMLKNSSWLQMDWDGKNSMRKTAFQLACCKGHVKIAEMIMNKSAELKIDLNTNSGPDGYTAFHLACMGGDSEIERSNCTRIVEMLIDQSEYHKIDVTTKTNRGLNGYQIAKRCKNTGVINLIKAKRPCLLV